MSNIRIDSVVSDPFGKSAKAIMKDILPNSEFKPEDATKHLKKSLIKKVDQIKEALQDFSVTDDQHLKMNIAYDHLDVIDTYIEKVEAKLNELAQPFEDKIRLLSTIPGLQRRSIISILVETGIDMS